MVGAILCVFNTTGRAGSNAPTAWQQPFRLTWSWRASPSWKTRGCSSAVASSVTLSPARPPSTERSGLCAPRGSSATEMITERPPNPRVPGRPAGKPRGSWSPPPQERTRLPRPSLAERRPPWGGTGAGSCNCCTQTPRGSRAGAKRWRQKLKRTTFQRKVSVKGNATRTVWGGSMEVVHFYTPRVCVCVFVSVFQFSAKSEVQWEAHSFSCPRSSSSSTGCVSRTWWDTKENILALTLLFLHNTCVYEHGRGGSAHLWPRIQMQHTPRGQRCLVDVSLTLFTARFSDPKQVVDNSNAAAAEAVTPFCNLQQKRLPLGEVHGD